MSKQYAVLPTISLNANTSYMHPHELPELVHLDNPATDVMIDLEYIKSVAISPETYISDALIDMRVNGSHLLLVVDSHEKVIGFISSEDIIGERTMKFVVEKRIPRADVKVRMVMTPQEKIPAIDVAELKHAKVANVVETLHAAKQHDALVVEVDNVSNKQTVVGLFSLSDISKQLGKDVTNDISYAHTIAELQRNIG